MLNELKFANKLKSFEWKFDFPFIEITSFNSRGWNENWFKNKEIESKRRNKQIEMRKFASLVKSLIHKQKLKETEK